jgi:hypothetical protein
MDDVPALLGGARLRADLGHAGVPPTRNAITRLEEGIEDRDVDAHDEADREDQDRQIADLLPRRPRDLAELGPDLVE